MAAAGRVEFGRFEATQRAVWIAFAYFASLGVERICYATVEHVAERAKVSDRTVQRHIPALMERGRIYAENRVGGRTPAVWKVILPDELITPGVTACRTIQEIVRCSLAAQRSCKRVQGEMGLKVAAVRSRRQRP